MVGNAAFKMARCSQAVSRPMSKLDTTRSTLPFSSTTRVPPHQHDMGRGKGWCADEELLACKAWLQASEDAKRGSSQKMAALQARAAKNFERMLQEQQNLGWKRETNIERSGESIIQRAKKVKKSCIVFQGYIEQLRAANLTGAPTDRDILQAAQAAYNNRIDVSKGSDRRHIYRFFGDDPSDLGPRFPHMKCYLWLRETSFWERTFAAISGPKMGAADVADVEDAATVVSQGDVDSAKVTKEEKKGNVPESSGSESIGSARKSRLAGKRQLEQNKQMEILEKGTKTMQGLLEQSQKRTKLSEKLVQAETLKARMALFAMQGTSPGMFQSFLRAEQERVLKEMEKENKDEGVGAMAGAGSCTPSEAFASTTVEDLEVVTPSKAENRNGRPAKRLFSDSEDENEKIAWCLKNG